MFSSPGVYTCLLPTVQSCSCPFSSSPFFTGLSEEAVKRKSDRSSPPPHDGLWGLASPRPPLTRHAQAIVTLFFQWLHSSSSQPLCTHPFVWSMTPGPCHGHLLPVSQGPICQLVLCLPCGSVFFPAPVSLRLLYSSPCFLWCFSLLHVNSVELPCCRLKGC